MGQMRRFLIDSSCVFAESFGDLQYLRNKYTVAGNPTIVKSLYGKAMDFDGANDYVDLKAPMIPTGPFTMLFAIKPGLSEIAGDGDIIFSQYKAGQTGRSLFYFATNESISDSLSGLATGVAISDTSKWYDMAFTHSVTHATNWYIDGAFSNGPGAAGADVYQGENLIIGNSSVWDKMKATLAYLIIYKRVCSAKEILNLATGKAF